MDVVNFRAKPPKRIFMRWKNSRKSTIKMRHCAQQQAKKDTKPGTKLHSGHISIVAIAFAEYLKIEHERGKKKQAQQKHNSFLLVKSTKCTLGREQHLCELHSNNFCDALRSRFDMVLFSFWQRWWPVQPDISGMCMWATKCCRFRCDFAFVLVNDRVRCTFFLSLVCLVLLPKLCTVHKPEKLPKIHTFALASWSNVIRTLQFVQPMARCICIRWNKHRLENAHGGHRTESVHLHEDHNKRNMLSSMRLK